MQSAADSDEVPTNERSTPLQHAPINSYRVQLGGPMTLDRAAAILPYLTQLGVTDVYTSPYFMAGRESVSGYDVVDYAAIHPELGGVAGFERFAAALRRNSLGHIIDLVPNHMGADPVRNRWWRDVLAYGPRSEFAEYFDIDWQPSKKELHGKLLLPILGRPYGAALDAGDIRITRRDESAVVEYGGSEWPLNPGTVGGLGDVALLSAEDLHALLERQSYRLAYWRTAADEINYRRFFDIDGLVGLRMDREDVFHASHAFVADLVSRRIVTGIRVDHPDGLADPAEYFRRLRALTQSDTGTPLHVVAEKILTDVDQLPSDWLVHGTTGYDFANLVGGLFVHARGLALVRKTYEQMTGQRHTFDEEAYASRRHIMATTLASELQMLADLLNRISERGRNTRDFTLNNLRRAIAELVSHLTVYRTYIVNDEASPRDRCQVHEAAAAAADRSPFMEPSVFEFIEAVMLGPHVPAGATYPPVDQGDVTARRYFTRRLQQFAASVFAKGVEDTAFYRHQPLLSLNEVGGRPSSGATDPSEFHRENAWRANSAPYGLLTTSTHDTKLGEDARARLAALTEMPGEWRRHVRQWKQSTKRHAVSGSRQMPDANDRYRVFQLLVSTWPCNTDGIGSEAVDAEYVNRIAACMLKSVREAKRHTSWINQNPAYEASLDAFIRSALSGRSGDRFIRTAMPFVQRVARVGVVSSLAQLVLKLSSPGVADIYQGSERWNVNMVDPDNRRVVDFEEAQRQLDALEPIIAHVQSGAPDAAAHVRILLDEWPSGHIKLLVTTLGLRLRRAHPDLFVTGRYEPVDVVTSGTPEILAFIRRSPTRLALTAIPRFVAGLMNEEGWWPLGASAWGTTMVELPPGSPDRWTNVFTGEHVQAEQTDASTALQAATLFATLPVGVWTADVSRNP